MSNATNSYTLNPLHLELSQIEEKAKGYRETVKDLFKDVTKFNENEKIEYFKGIATKVIQKEKKQATVNIDFNSDIEEDGQLIVKKGYDITINIKKSDNLERKIFTLFHKVAHYLLHVITDTVAMSLDEVGETNSEIGIIESEANRFAANFLVGIDDLIEQLKKTDELPITDNSIVYSLATIKSYYGVSADVVRYQVKNHLDLILEKLKNKKH